MVTVPCSGAVPNAQVPPTSAPILSLVATLPVAVVLMAVLKLSSPAVGASSVICTVRVPVLEAPAKSLTVNAMESVLSVAPG